MTKKLAKEALLSELAAVKAMLSSLPEDDFIGRIGLESRQEEIEADLGTLARSRDTLANVALMFHGRPVRGSRSIDAEFAARALENYQDIVAKRVATFENGGLAQRGPVPSKQAASLNITGVLHGSFGFILEENDFNEPQLVNSTLKEAVQDISCIMERFTAEGDAEFDEAISDMDQRLFSAVKNFLKLLHDDEATLRIVEGDSDKKFDGAAVERGHRRCQEAEIEEDTLSLTGTLLGVVPYGRRFEMKAKDGEVIKGKVGPLFSRDYLSRIEKDEQVIGREWQVKILKKTIERPGHRTHVNYTLLELNAL